MKLSKLDKEIVDAQKEYCELAIKMKLLEVKIATLTAKRYKK